VECTKRDYRDVTMPAAGGCAVYSANVASCLLAPRQCDELRPIILRLRICCSQLGFSPLRNTAWYLAACAGSVERVPAYLGARRCSAYRRGTTDALTNRLLGAALGGDGLDHKEALNGNPRAAIADTKRFEN
jgi:hypothetical protein